MQLFVICALGALGSSVAAAAVPQPPQPGPDGKYTIQAAGIKAQFIPYGATLTNLFVKNAKGIDTDVVLGYDNASFYPTDASHPVYNAIPGRYVNRIGNATYTLDGKTYHTEQNDGPNTLHSGTNNWSYRTWTVAALTAKSITLAIHDPSNASQGMPGAVDARVTYSVADGAVWRVSMSARAPQQRTPLMLTQHTYFNLDAYRDPRTDKIWNHTLYLPHSRRYLEMGAGSVPTGRILSAAPGSINDFASRPGIQLGHASGDAAFPTNCGPGCEGYNGYWIIDDDGASSGAVAATLASAASGIKAELRTDQRGLQVYTCNWFDGTSNPLKSTQRGVAGRETVTRSSCVAIEAHDWVDGINHPEWGRKEAEITGPGETYTWESSWTFGKL